MLAGMHVMGQVFIVVVICQSPPNQVSMCYTTKAFTLCAEDSSALAAACRSPQQVAAPLLQLSLGIGMCYNEVLGAKVLAVTSRKQSKRLEASAFSAALHNKRVVSILRPLM